MRRLIAVEIRRLVSRRLVRAISLLAVLGIAVAAVVTLIRSHRGVGTVSGPGGIGSVVVLDPRFHLAHLKDAFKGTVVPVVAAAWLLAASFVGAEWHAGTMGTLLTWEPRRIRVLAAKAVAALALAFLATVAFQVLLGLALAPAAVLRGTTEGIDATWFRDTAFVILRGAALASVFAAIGFSIASVARNTGAALGVGFFYLLVLEQFMAALKPGWRPWMLVPNSAVFVAGQQIPEIAPGRTVVEAAVILLAYTAGLLTIAGAMFQRRDVS